VLVTTPRNVTDAAFRASGPGVRAGVVLMTSTHEQKRTMIVMATLRKRSRTARLLTVAVVSAAAAFAMGGAPGAVTDSATRGVVCTPAEVSGVDVDNCVGDPNGDSVNNPNVGPDDGPQLWVVPRFRIGLGV
jgi:hypothetical protein